MFPHKELIIFFVCFFSIVEANTITCSELKVTYNDKQCCDQSTADTCLRSLPSCTDSAVVAGQICTDINGKAFVKGLAEAFDLSSSTNIVLKKSIIPDTNANYDLGSAEYKFRHQYLSNT